MTDYPQLDVMAVGAHPDDVEIACANASNAIDAIFMANASATIVIDIVPARCSIDIDASAQCAAECDANFDATATPPPRLNVTKGGATGRPVPG